MLAKLALIALAGAAGTLARYGLSGLVHAHVEKLFPWGTVAVNLVGSLLFGVAWAATEDRLSIGPETRAVVLIGFMGAFTTFSTLMFETAMLLEDSEWLLAAANLALQNGVGLAALFAGLALGRLV